MRHPIQRFTFSLALCALLQSSILYAENASLPSWNEGNAKQSIINFVEKVTNKGSSDYVPEERRIAVFDNDGTLWAEQPIYFQLAFAVDRVKELSAQHPEWKNKQPFKAILENDAAYLHSLTSEKVTDLITKTHMGMTSDEFDLVVKKWLKTAKHPKYNKLYTELTYQPMIELLHYLRSNGFKTFIVSGGGIEFIRSFSEDAYGIPPWQVVGSQGELKYDEKDGKHVLMRLPKINFIDDKAGKPVGIQTHIGIRPIAAFGNSDGDYQMLEWTTEGAGPRFGMIIHHTDPVREYRYDKNSSIGQLDKALDDAKQHGWIVTSIKDDWKRVWK